MGPNTNRGTRNQKTDLYYPVRYREKGIKMFKFRARYKAALVHTSRFLLDKICSGTSVLRDREPGLSERKEKRSVYQAAKCNQKPIWYSRCSAFSPLVFSSSFSCVKPEQKRGLIDSPGAGTAKYSYLSFHGHCTTKTAFATPAPPAV